MFAEAVVGWFVAIVLNPHYGYAQIVLREKPV